MHCTNKQNETQYRQPIPVARSQKSNNKYIAEKVCLGWKLFSIINRHGGTGRRRSGWNKNVLGGKKSKK